MKIMNWSGSLRASLVSADPKFSTIQLVLASSRIWRMTEALIGFVHRTLTSNLVAPKIGMRRLVICREAMSAALLRTTPHIFRRIIDGEWDGLLDSVEFGLLLRNADRSDPVTAYHSQTKLSIILPRVPGRERNERWFRLATDHLGCSRSVLGGYLAHGDSMTLAISIRILRNIIHNHFDTFWFWDPATRWKVLELVSRFDIRDTLPTLQHDFCDLWNETVHLARSSPDFRFRSISIAILKNFRNAYITLHQNTDSAPTAFSSSSADVNLDLTLSSSYPLCNISGHRASRTVHPPVTPRVPSFPTPLPDYSGSQLPYDFASSPQNIVVSSSYASQVTQINVDGIVTSTSHSTPTGPAASTTIVLSSSASPPAQTLPSGAALPYYVNITTVPHSVIPDTPPTFPLPVLDNTVKPSLVPQSAADPVASRSDHAPFGPDTDPSAPATPSPVAPPPPISALDRGATTDGEDSAKVALRNDKATGPPSADPVATTTAPPNSIRSPQPPPPRSSTDIAIASPSRSSQDAEQRGNQPPHSLHGHFTSKT